MKIKLIERRKPGTKTGPGKFYASPVNVGKKTLRDIAHDIAGRSSLTRGDIENVLANFMDCLPHYLRDGFSVQLGESGTMRLTLSSEGAATEKAFKTETIKPRVTFTPGVELKTALRDNSYETVRKTEEAGKDKKKKGKERRGKWTCTRHRLTLTKCERFWYGCFKPKSVSRPKYV